MYGIPGLFQQLTSGVGGILCPPDSCEINLLVRCRHCTWCVGLRRARVGLRRALSRLLAWTFGPTRHLASQSRVPVNGNTRSHRRCIPPPCRSRATRVRTQVLGMLSHSFHKLPSWAGGSPHLCTCCVHVAEQLQSVQTPHTSAHNLPAQVAGVSHTQALTIFLLRWRV